MLSITNISAGHASHYYEKDDYYAKDSPEHKESSQWFGKGAEQLGLTGQIEKEAFIRILEGRLPDGTQLGRIIDGKIDHAAGLDMTFSAPKSVSILSEIKGDSRIIEAHARAVEAALRYAQANCINTRVKTNGEVIKEQVDNVIVAMFRHNTSRAMDPQLHTHCVLANIVQKHDGQWRSGEFKSIFEHKLLLGQIYRSELAAELRELGYEIRHTGKGLFEVVGVPDEALKNFSKRTAAKEEALKGYDYVNSKTAEQAVLMTRESKQTLTKEVLQERWRGECAAIGLDVAKLGQRDKSLESVADRLQTVTEYLKSRFREFHQKLGLSSAAVSSWINECKPQSIEQRAVQYAIAHLSERSAVFTGQALYMTAFSGAMGEMRWSALDQEVGRLISSKVLLPIPLCGRSDTYTTKAALQKEKESIAFAMGQSSKLYTKVELQQDSLLDKLSSGQRAAATLILSTNDRVVCVQGYAGTGKTFMLDTARQLAEARGKSFIGLAPSSSAASVLNHQTNMPSQTLHKFLWRYKGVIEGRGTAQGRQKMKEDLKNKIIILDEASLAATSQMHALLKVAKDLDVRVVLVGDVKQLGAVEAGKPFYQLQDAGVKTALMAEIKRQTNLDLKAAVLETVEAVDSYKSGVHIKAALDKVGENFIKTDRGSLAATAAGHYMKLNGDALVTAPSRELRAEVNQCIRGALKANGTLQGPDVTLSILDNCNFTRAEKTLSANYAVGHCVVFGKDYSSIKVLRGDYYKVLEVNKYRVVKLANDAGRQILWNPTKMAEVEVFTQRPIGIAQGDQLRWTRNSQNINNSDIAKVVDATDSYIKLQLADGRLQTFAKSDTLLRHLDHGYASTVYGAQGKTARNVVGILESGHPHLTDQRSFYVTLSRAQQSAILITDDKEKLVKTLAEKAGNRQSAAEHQGARLAVQ